jgi:HAD superfamily hydrolase (TIGR01490 family)
MSEKRKFAVFDIDGTLFRNALFHNLMRQLRRNGIIDDAEFIEADELWQKHKQRQDLRGYHAWSDNNVKIFERNLTKLSKQQLTTAYQHVFEQNKDYTYCYTKNLLKNLKTKGYYLITISGSLQELLDPFATYHGFDLAIGEINEVDSRGVYTGKNIRKTYKDKHVFLEQLIKEHNLTLEGSVGIGDTTGDIELLDMVEHPIAFNPNIDLLDYAKEKGWKVVVERKNVIFELEPSPHGYLLADTAA